ncbi:MAG: hypothetical protein JAY67_17260 [Candidatus Thiodiazotropha taylori]|nr:hypothetical protein [Candidatus Thiodiazotropha taylori]
MSIHTSAIKIFETSVFQETARNYITDDRLEALKYYLAGNPLVGKPVDNYPGLMCHTFGDEQRLKLIYMYFPKENLLVFNTLHEESQQLPDPHSDEGQASVNVLIALGRYGVVTAAKSIWDFVKQALE